MRLHRFYFSEEIGERERVSTSDRALIHQWKDVFRFDAGDEIVLFDNSGFEYLARFEILKKDEAVMNVSEKRNKKDDSPNNLFLFAALVKKNNFETIIEKATELGVAGIRPIISERSEKKGLNMERAQKILIEASEQSGRVILPTLKEPQALAQALESVADGHEEKMNLIAFDPTGKIFHKANLDLVKQEKQTGLLIGPEGGWSEKELEHFRQSGIPIYSIGTQVLRAETAAIAITALFTLL